ncbi:precorrin-3B C(17)-methyltransferase [Deferribacterales bacterium RsTz2092]|nr:precorrin-3B C(17)-methyltransferase [Deferribacterales bacterium]
MQKNSNGTLAVVGLGFHELMSPLATNLLSSADVVAGYKRYIDEAKPYLNEKQEIFQTGMRHEIERVEYAVKQAVAGRRACIVCGGDPSIYGMASLAYELAATHKLATGNGVEITVAPSVTAAMAASARLGAPISEDVVLLSLSDQLTPWNVIEKRIDAVNVGDFVCALYNPASLTRKEQLPYTLKKFRERGNLVIGAVRNAFRDREELYIATIDDFALGFVDMLTLIIVGNTRTRLIDGKMVTPRGYKVNE